MKTVFYLSTCDTCKRLLAAWDLPEDVEKRDIKSTPISEFEIEAMRALAGSYEALFSKRARLYKERNLGAQALTEEDYKALILEHYTFLKRPVFIWEDQIFIGNSAKTEQAVQAFLSLL